MYQKLCSNCPVKMKACMKWQWVALVCKQTCAITSIPTCITAPSIMTSVMFVPYCCWYRAGPASVLFVADCWWFCHRAGPASVLFVADCCWFCHTEQALHLYYLLLIVVDFVTQIRPCNCIICCWLLLILSHRAGIAACADDI